MISNNMFFFWGSKKMSWMRYLTLYSFRKFNPDWNMTLYISTMSNNNYHVHNNQDYSYGIGKDYFSHVSKLNINIVEVDLDPNLNPVIQSDLFRWEVLSKANTFYSDMDILYIKPMNSLMSVIPDTAKVVLSCINIDRWNYWVIGLVGSNSSGKFLEVSQCAKDNVGVDDYQSTGALSLNHVFGRVENHSSDIYIFPSPIIYPFSYRETRKIFDKGNKCLPKSTVGVHWYGGQPNIQKWNKLLDDSNYKQYNNLFTRCVKDYIYDN